MSLPQIRDAVDRLSAGARIQRRGVASASTVVPLDLVELLRYIKQGVDTSERFRSTLIRTAAIFANATAAKEIAIEIEDRHGGVLLGINEVIEVLDDISDRTLVYHHTEELSQLEALAARFAAKSSENGRLLRRRIAILREHDDKVVVAYDRLAVQAERLNSLLKIAKTKLQQEIPQHELSVSATESLRLHDDVEFSSIIDEINDQYHNSMMYLAK